MTYKQIETSREVRLWIGQIIVPAVATVAAMMTVPEVRQGVVNTAREVGQTIKKKFSKGKAKKGDSVVIEYDFSKH